MELANQKAAGDAVCDYVNRERLNLEWLEGAQQAQAEHWPCKYSNAGVVQEGVLLTVSKVEDPLKSNHQTCISHIRHYATNIQQQPEPVFSECSC